MRSSRPTTPNVSPNLTPTNLRKSNEIVSQQPAASANVPQQPELDITIQPAPNTLSQPALVAPMYYYKPHQLVGQQLKVFVESTLPPFLVGPLIARFFPGSPILEMLQVSTYAVNGVITRAAMAGLSREYPLDGLRAMGGGDAFTGFIREAVSRYGSMGAITIGAIFISDFINWLDGLELKMDEPSEPVYNVLHDEEYKGLVLGTLGYFVAELVYRGAKKTLCCLPKEQEQIIREKENLNLAQKIIGNLLSVGNAAFTAEAVRTLTNLAGCTVFNDPTLQMIVAVTSMGANDLANHAFFSPYKKEEKVIASSGIQVAVVDETAVEDDETAALPREAAAGETPVEVQARTPARKSRMVAVALYAAYFAGYCGVSYGVTTLAKMLDPSIMAENESSKLERYAVAAGSAMVARNVLPVVASNIQPVVKKVVGLLSACKASLFGNKAKDYTLLHLEEGNANTYDTFVPASSSKP